MIMIFRRVLWSTSSNSRSFGHSCKFIMADIKPPTPPTPSATSQPASNPYPVPPHSWNVRWHHYSIFYCFHSVAYYAERHVVAQDSSKKKYWPQFNNWVGYLPRVKHTCTLTHTYIQRNGGRETCNKTFRWLSTTFDRNYKWKRKIWNTIWQ